MATRTEYTPMQIAAVQKHRSELHPDREACSALFRRVFPADGNLKAFNGYASAISRARSGVLNHAERMCELGRKMRRAGYTLKDWQMLIAFLDAFGRSLWGEEIECTDMAIRKASMRETVAEGEEAVLQLAIHEGMTVHALKELKAKVEANIALDTDLLVRITRRLELEQR